MSELKQAGVKLQQVSDARKCHQSNSWI